MRKLLWIVAAVAAAIGNADLAAARECNIKGNVNTKGERIYHVPGQKYYNDTVIQPSHGERWFCSEEEARAAGWRRSKV
ncbi:hypothetical protein GCM10011321_31300 [Youhaiella tibetensis]|uniref:sunset domain-containing protein n=1 Tax=Paradevosia tibetensis TaxID=1447062 RepID=UPI001998D866|nr:hypothetical protein [Youhaiella tibetensis]GGF38118.1 hypothetical protein GCM10011321_31300 [Youhaiella tibetensis]